jgi:hypothetical protein
VENGLRWCIDVTFGEDASAIRLRNAAHNFSFLRRLALNLFRADALRKRSLPHKRKADDWNPDYLARLLGLAVILWRGPDFDLSGSRHEPVAAYTYLQSWLAYGLSSWSRGF